jgi:hypothetical protein
MERPKVALDRTKALSREQPSLHVDYQRCHIKQYFKERRAETTFNDAYDCVPRMLTEDVM